MAVSIKPPSAIISPHPLFIAGPTAVGKSAIALALAEKIGGEIISVDSMQVYRGLDIGTAKPTAEEQKKIRHHLIDIADLNETFDAAQFCRLAQEAVNDIIARGQVPIFCGGTGLYFKAYLEGLGESPPADAALRAELNATPLENLLIELQERDPAAFDKIDRKNPRRVMRAIEIIRLSGKPLSQQRADWTQPKEIHPSLFGVARQTEQLRDRINERVDEMFRRGLVAETESLMRAGLERNQAAMQAIGYRQVVEHLRGERDLNETIELVKIRTRQFAKRQMTWFRRQLNVKWIELNDASDLANIADQLRSCAF